MFKKAYLVISVLVIIGALFTLQYCSHQDDAAPLTDLQKLELQAQEIGLDTEKYPLDYVSDKQVPEMPPEIWKGIEARILALDAERKANSEGEGEVSDRAIEGCTGGCTNCTNNFTFYLWFNETDSSPYDCIYWSLAYCSDGTVQPMTADKSIGQVISLSDNEICRLSNIYMYVWRYDPLGTCTVSCADFHYWWGATPGHSGTQGDFCYDYGSNMPNPHMLYDGQYIGYFSKQSGSNNCYVDVYFSGSSGCCD